MPRQATRLTPYVRAVARRDRCSNAATTAVPSRTAAPHSAIPTCIRPRFPRPDLWRPPPYVHALELFHAQHRAAFLSAREGCRGTLLRHYRGLLEANAAAATVAFGIVAEQFDARRAQCLDPLGQRIADAAPVALTSFHSLDGWQGHAGKVGQRLLVDAEQRPRGPQLCGNNHRSYLKSTISPIRTDVQDINSKAYDPYAARRPSFGAGQTRDVRVN